jgi:thiamine kinase-like enzyme
MAPPSNIPERADNIDAVWLTEAMRSTIVLADTDAAPVVASFEIEPLEGVLGGVMGDLSRLHLSWNLSDAALPASVVLKVPTLNETNRSLGSMFGQYAAEDGFYADIAPATGIRVPRCWHRAADPDTDRYSLLLEDVGHFEAVDPIDGVSVDRAGAALDELAEFHATWWDSDELESFDWLPQSDPETMRSYHPILEASWPGFRDATRHLLTDADRDLAQRFVDEYVNLIANIDDLPLTLIHRDFHLGNMLFDGVQPVVYDWGNVATGGGLYDVAYFLAGSLSLDDLRNHSDTLLDRYRKRLAERGIERTDADFLYENRVNALFCLIVPIMAGGGGFEANERSSAVLQVTIQRLFAYLASHNAELAFDGR